MKARGTPKSRLFRQNDICHGPGGPIRSRIARLIVVALLVGGRSSAQTQQLPQNRDPQFQIEVDVTGKLQKEKRKDQWGELRSTNFVVAGDADDNDLRTAASELEKFRADFARLFPRAKAPSSVATRVIVFRDDDSLRSFRPEGPASSQSYFQPDRDLNHVVLHAGDKLSPDILREYTRVLMRDSITPVPLWLETGIVEYFSATKLMRLGEDRVIKSGIDEYKGLKAKNLLPLNILLSIDRDSFQRLDKEVQKMFTVESCLLFQYLLQSRRVSATLRMTNAIAEGWPAERAFRDIFKLPMATIQENLKRQIEVSNYYGWNILLEGLTLDRKKNVIRIIAGQGFRNIAVSFDTLRAQVEALPVRILSPAEADTYRGDLQLHNGRLPEAEALLRQALREDPVLPTAHSALGHALSLQGKFSEAHEYLDKARVLNPQGNALGYYYTAVAIQNEARAAGKTLSKDQLEDIRISLRDSVDIAPEFVPAAELLAQTQLAMGSNLNDIAKLLVASLKRSPGRTSILMALARVTISGGDKASAGWMLQNVIASGGTDTATRNEAQTLLARLNLTFEQKTAFAIFEVKDGPPFGTESKLITKADIKAATPANDTKIVRGFLVSVECTKGLTLHVRVGIPDMDERVENLHTDKPTVDWVTDSGENVDAVKCETLRYQRPVAITYIPKRKGLMMGEPLVVEFCSGVSYDCTVRRSPPPGLEE